MMISSMSSRDKRALSIAGFILIPSLFYVFGVQPYFESLSSIKEQTEDERSMLQRERGIAKKLPLLPEEKAAASEQLRQEAARLFVGEDELVATGNLADYVAVLADVHGVILQQSETRPGTQVAAGVRALQVEVRAEGDVYAVLNFLRDLETGDKLIRISNLTLEKSTRIASAPIPQQPQMSQQDMYRQQQMLRQQRMMQRGWGGNRGAGMRSSMGSGQISTSIGVAGGMAPINVGANSGTWNGQAGGNYNANMQQGGMQAPGYPGMPQQPVMPPPPQEVLSMTASIHGYRLDGVPFNMDAVVDGAPSPFERQITGLASLDQVIERNPFDPNRRPPNSDRYAMGPPPVEQPAMRLLGTGISDNYSFAVISYGGDPKGTIVPIGGNAFGHTLMDINKETAVLKTPAGGTMVLRTAPAGTYASSGPIQSIGGMPPGMGGRMGQPVGFPTPEQMQNMTPEQREAVINQIRQQVMQSMGTENVDVQVMEVQSGQVVTPPPATGGNRRTPNNGGRNRTGTGNGSIRNTPRQTEQLKTKIDSQSTSQSKQK